MIKEYVKDQMGDYTISITNKMPNQELKDFVKKDKFDKFIADNPYDTSVAIAFKQNNKAHVIIRYTKNNITYDYILRKHEIRTLKNKTKKILTYKEKIKNFNEALKEIKNKYNLKELNEEEKESLKQLLNEDIIIYSYEEETESKIKLKRIEYFIKQDGEEVPIFITQQLEDLDLQKLMMQYMQQEERKEFNSTKQIINNLMNISSKDILTVLGIGLISYIGYKVLDD